MDGSAQLETAIGCAVQRELHRRRDAKPSVLDDWLAHRLATWPWHRIDGASEPPQWSGVRAFLVARQRFAEDRLEAGAFAQYVVLGSGLDSFAWRRPEALASVRVFEVDRPRLQGWKRARIAEIGLDESRNPVFVGLDFERESLDDALAAAGLDWHAPTLFSWLGVTTYLEPQAIESTLRSVARCTSAEIVLTYSPGRALLGDAERELREAQAWGAAQIGEPYLSEFTPDEIAALVSRCGLVPVQDLGASELHALYFAGRSDGLTPSNGERLLVARTKERAAVLPCGGSRSYADAAATGDGGAYQIRPAVPLTLRGVAC